MKDERLVGRWTAGMAGPRVQRVPCLPPVLCTVWSCTLASASSEDLCGQGPESPCPSASERRLRPPPPQSALSNFKAVAPLIEISIWEQADDWPVAPNFHQ